MPAVLSKALWEEIDSGAPDGGLQSCLDAAKVHPKIQQVLKNEGVEDLRRFAGFYPEGTDAEAIKARDIELKQTIDASDDAEAKKKVQLGNLRQAWQAAHTLWGRLQQPTAAPTDDPDDVEKPLPPGVQEKSRSALDRDLQLGAFGLSRPGAGAYKSLPP